MLIAKNKEAAAALERLRSFLSPKEAQLAEVLVSMWENQQRAITYAELRDAILSGQVPLEYLMEWQQDYARFVVRVLAPMYREAIERAAEVEARKYAFKIDFARNGIRDWIEQRGAELVAGITTEQQKALQVMIERSAILGDLTVDELSRVIRPTIGLTSREATAVSNYFNNLREAGRGYKEAKKLAANYAARLHRHRAMRIARTELAFAYNNGTHQGIIQAQERGLIGLVNKVWCTADDERTCERCAPLDNVKVPMDAHFEDINGKRVLLPPLHPHCRCTVLYEEA
jgi:SPP1 gp7 family putative phage head morphogenesis protein